MMESQFRHEQTIFKIQAPLHSPKTPYSSGIDSERGIIHSFSSNYSLVVFLLSFSLLHIQMQLTGPIGAANQPYSSSTLELQHQHTISIVPVIQITLTSNQKKKQTLQLFKTNRLFHSNRWSVYKAIILKTKIYPFRS